MPNTQNLATVGVTNRQDTDNIIVEQGGNIRRVQYEDIKTGILRGDAADGTISTFEESAEEFPIPAPATPQKTLWGRVKKFCSDFNDWKTGVMLFGHLVNNAESDSDTLPLAASVAKLLQEQITTNTGAIAQLNSDFNNSIQYSNGNGTRIDSNTIEFSIKTNVMRGLYLVDVSIGNRHIWCLLGSSWGTNEIKTWNQNISSKTTHSYGGSFENNTFKVTVVDQEEFPSNLSLRWHCWSIGHQQ